MRLLLDALGLGHQRPGMEGAVCFSEGALSRVRGCLAARNWRPLTADGHAAIRLGEEQEAASQLNGKLGKKLAKWQKPYSISRGKLGENSPRLSVIPRTVYWRLFCSSWDIPQRKLEALSCFSSSLLLFFGLNSTSFLADTAKPRRSKFLQAARLLSPSSSCFPIAWE